MKTVTKAQWQSLAKKWAEASDAFLRASTLLPGWWRPYLHRASALEGMGDLEGAVEQYENMLEVYEGAEGIRGHAVERIRVLRLARGRNPSPPESERPFSAPP